MRFDKDKEDDKIIADLELKEAPAGVDRRRFLMRSASIGAAAVLTGCTTQEKTAQVGGETPAAPSPAQVALAAPPLSEDLNVVKKSKGPVMTVLDEFYKVGPGPSSSHTIGPMRITYDFYQRCTKLPADQLAKATGLRVNLFGSLSATGKGHGTERASLAGLIGKEPATVDPAFLDSLVSKPDQVFPVKLGDKTLQVSLKDIIYDAPKGEFHHPNTMTCKLLARDTALLEQEYYSVGGGFIEWKGYTPPKKNSPKYPFSTMKELRAHADGNKLTLAQVMLANEMAIPGKTEAEVWAFVDKIINAMNATVKSGLAVSENSLLPGPIKLASKAATVYKRAMDDKYQSDRGIGVLSAYALAGSEENGRGHLVITAPTGGSAGVMPALVHALGEGGRKLPLQKIRNGMLVAAAVGYLCKHNATLSAAEGGCQAEIGVASAMAAALTATAYDAESRVVENAAESALEHHLGMTCDPVAGFVQVHKRNDFTVNRAMFILNGYVFDKRLQYSYTVWTAAGAASIVVAGNIGWRFNKAITITGGYNGAPGSRSLVNTFPFFAGNERTMADNFFRPGFTQGVWATGEPVKGLNYNAFVGNGLNTLNISAVKIDTNLLTAGSVWWEPLGDYGEPGKSRNMYDDYFSSRKTRIRVGTAFTRSREDRFSNLDLSNPDNTSLYNSDGVLTFSTGAFAPGVTVERANYRMSAIDGGIKWNGLAVNGQYYFRWLNDFIADGPLPLSSTFDHGFELSASHFVIPKKLNVFGRGSTVFGQFNNSWEYAGGAKWHFLPTERMWMSGELMKYHRVPYSGAFTPYTSGMTGWGPVIQAVLAF